MINDQRHLRARLAALAVGCIAALAAATTFPAGVDASTTTGPRFDKHRVVTTGLDNPRQLSVLPNGDLLVAEAGHGGNNPDNCFGRGEDQFCIGKTGKVTRIHGDTVKRVMTGLLSGASKDGSFAVGSDGASKRLGGGYFAIITAVPPGAVPQGLPGWQSGQLLKRHIGRPLRAIANVTAFEQRNDPDGEGVDSNPYSVLALRDQVLVADAAGDYIASVKNGKVRLWALMPEYGKRIDAVPTTLARGADGRVYVGELHSEIPGKARVWKYDRLGNPIRWWGGFTSITGVARGKDGSLYVSELFGGSCGFDQIPTCFPGRVVKVSPNGDRSYRRVPFPAGIVVRNGKVSVVTFSVSPSTGFGGNPAWSGQIWRVFGG
jgi:hypothetical protein